MRYQLLMLLLSTMPLFFGFSSWFVFQLLSPCCWFQGVLLPKSFNQFMSERNICISMAASILDVCRKNPDRGVDLILSVSVGICSNMLIFSYLFLLFHFVGCWYDYFPGGGGEHIASSFLIYPLNQQACIESEDPIIQALGFQSLSHLCEADVIGMLLCFACSRLCLYLFHIMRPALEIIVASSFLLLLLLFSP